MENHIQPNYIITLTEIKKAKEGRGSKEAWKSGRLSEVKKKKNTETKETVTRRTDMYLCTKILSKYNYSPTI